MIYAYEKRWKIMAKQAFFREELVARYEDPSGKSLKRGLTNAFFSETMSNCFLSLFK